MIRRAITVDARVKPNYSGIRYPCWPSTRRERPFEEVAANFVIRNEQERAALRQEYEATRALYQGGNAIFSLASPRLGSSNCQAPASTCSCQTRLTCFGRFGHSRPQRRASRNAAHSEHVPFFKRRRSNEGSDYVFGR